MQGADPASLAIGTQVSAKYKGAYCEAKVKSVDKQIKVRVTLKNPNGTTGPSLTIRDHEIISINGDAPLQTNVVVKLKHPDNNEQVEATVKQIQDQSRYTVIFNDGDIATLKRNALCMKSGKHFNASESLDNLPLTHPEHFSSPASNAGTKQRRRNKSGHNEDEASDEEDTSTDDEGGHEEDLVNDPYTSNIGRVVWAENTDKKTKAKDAWFLALIVAPTVTDSKIRTKKEFLIRSFKDGRYYTVSKKDTQKFRHNESPVKAKNDNNREAMERAITFLNSRELPPHWDRDILQSHEEESTNNSTTASSESEELDDDDEEEESPEEKDHLVAELYKHMEDRGSPIDKTPSIDGKDIDLFRLYKIVDKLGGHARVSNKNLWRQVAGKLGFFSTWGTNQVRVHYKRYLQSFEEFNRTLGCTMVNYPKGTPLLSSSRNRQVSGSSRVAMRGSSRVKASLEDSSKPDDLDESIEPILETSTPVQADLKKEVESPPSSTTKKSGKKSKREISAESARKKQMEELKMTTRPRRDSTSSLAAAMQVKAQKDSIGAAAAQATPKEPAAAKKPVVRMDRNKETENEVKKLVNSPPKQASVLSPKPPGSSEDNSSSDTERKKPGRKPGPQPGMKKKEVQPTEETTFEASKESNETDVEDFQHLGDEVCVVVGDRVRVFYKFDTIYEAKVKKVQKPKDGCKWPKFHIHYQGWNSRHDEWIKRSRIKENLSWSKDRVIDSTELEQVDEPVVPERKKPGPKVGRTPSKKALVDHPGSSATKPEKSSRAGTPSSVTSKGSRTGSPALKRQSSRTSTKKGGESDSEEEDSESGFRKSSRIKTTSTSVPVPSPSSTSSNENRGGRGRKRVKEESENEEVEVEKDEVKVEVSEDIITPVKKRGRKPKVEESESESSKSEASTRSRGTPTREKKPIPSGRGTRGRGRGQKDLEEDLEDPYAFKEPENVEKDKVVPVAPTVTSTASTRRSRLDEKNSEALLPEAKKLKIESDSTDSSSSDQEIVKSKTRSMRSKKPQTSSEEEEKVSSEEPLTSAEVPEKIDLKNDSQESKMQFTKKQQEIFPNLASKMASNSTSKPMTTAIQAPPSVSSLSSEASDEVKSEEISSTKSDEQPQPQEEPQPPQQQPIVEAASVKKQRKTPSKPKSDELIDSESSDSEDQEDKPKKAIVTSETKKAAAAKKKPTESDDTEDEPLIKSNSRRGSQIDAKAASQVALTALASTASKKLKAKTEEPDDLDLACGETIPGSPVHPSSASTSMDVSPTSEVVSKPKIAPASSNTTRLEMPFASVPESVQGPQVASATSIIPATLPPASASETPDTASTPSRMSPTNANPAHEDGSKSPGGDSSEVDMESLKAESLDIEGSSSGEAKGQRGTKRKAPNDAGSRSPAPSRRKRRTRESSRGRGGGRGRHGSGRRDHDDTDESEEAKDSTFAGIGSLDNDALAALAQDRSSTKYNFYPDFDNSMDSNTRIAMIQQNIKNLKKAYSSIKSKLATTERQIKKIRRKEREKSDVTSTSTPNASSSDQPATSKTAIEASA